MARVAALLGVGPVAWCGGQGTSYMDLVVINGCLAFHRAHTVR